MEFYFEPNDVSTMDERAMAIFSSDSTRTAIAKKDALLHDGKNCLFSSGNEAISACYSFTEKWIPFLEAEFSFDIHIGKLGLLDLLTLRHGGFIRLTSEAIQVQLVTETGEFAADISGAWSLKGDKVIRIQKTREKVEFEIGDVNVFIDIPDNCQEGLEVIGLFGEVSDTEFGALSIAIKT